LLIRQHAGILAQYRAKVKKKTAKKKLEFPDFSVDKVVLSAKMLGKRREKVFIFGRKTRRKRTSAGTRATRSEGAPGETECVR